MHKHYIIHKPYGYLSQFRSGERLAHKKKYLGDLYDVPEGTMAIGRLDEPSEGLLLLTTNGLVSEQIRSNKVEKEYYVQVDGRITQKAIDELKTGVTISVNKQDYKTKIAHVEGIKTPHVLPYRSKRIRDDRHGPTSWVAITIKEGKFRQVRKMCAAVGFPVLRLIRVRVGVMSLSQIGREGILEVENLFS